MISCKHRNNLQTIKNQESRYVNYFGLLGSALLASNCHTNRQNHRKPYVFFNDFGIQGHVWKRLGDLGDSWKSYKNNSCSTIFASRGPSCGPRVVPKSLPGGVREGPGRVPEGSLSQVGSEVPLGALLGPLLEPSWSPLGPLLGPSWALLSLPGAVLGPLGAVLARLRAVLGLSWGHLGPSWSLRGAITTNHKNH